MEDKSRIFTWAQQYNVDIHKMFAAKEALFLNGEQVTYCGNRIYIDEMAAGETVAEFIGDDEITCITGLPEDRIAVGDTAGRVIFLRYIP